MPAIKEQQLASREFPCLHCGYDLRAAISLQHGFGVTCPECGGVNDARLLYRHGLNLKSKRHLALFILTPAAVLLLSVWLIEWWSQESVHAFLCLFFAPVVITVHMYTIWQMIDATIVLTRSKMRRLLTVALLSGLIIDLAGCVAVARWFL